MSETETYPFPSGQVGGHGQPPVDKMGRDMDEREQYRAILEDNLEYDILLENNPYDRDTIAEVMELLLDTICSKRQYRRSARVRLLPVIMLIQVQPEPEVPGIQIPEPR